MKAVKTKRVKSETTSKTKSTTKNGKERLFNRFTKDLNITDESDGSSINMKEKETTRNNRSKFKSVFKEKDASGKVIAKEVIKKKMRDGKLVKDKSRYKGNRK